MKKRRPDIWDAKLDDLTRRKVFDWMREMPYVQVQALVSKELGIRPAPGLHALSNFYSRMSEAVAVEEMTKAVTDAQAIEKTAAAIPNVSRAVAAGLGQLALNAIASRKPDDIKRFAELALSAQREARGQAEAMLARDRFEFDAAKAALACLPALRRISADKGKSEVDKINEARARLFGVTPE